MGPFTKVWVQTLAVIGASNIPAVGNTAVSFNGTPGVTSRSVNVSADNTAEVTFSPVTHQKLLAVSFSSVPVVWQSEINADYQELGEALTEMTRVEEDDWNIDEPVYLVACRVAAELATNSFPAPKLFSHGPKSVVFNWSHDVTNLYLTISSDYVSALVSSPERITRRVDLSTRGRIEPALFRGLLSFRPEHAVSAANAVDSPLLPLLV